MNSKLIQLTAIIGLSKQPFVICPSETISSERDIWELPRNQLLTCLCCKKAWLCTVYSRTLFVIAMVSAKDRLPPCEQIPKLLCCTDRVLDKCLPGCIDYLNEKCPHKMSYFEKIPPVGTEERKETTQVCIIAFGWMIAAHATSIKSFPAVLSKALKPQHYAFT